MEQIKSLEGTNFDVIYTAWNDAFSDYVRSWTREELQKMLNRRGYAAELSFGAFDGDKLVSFTLNGIGTYNGKRTAYDTGTGTVKGSAGKGLAKKIFNYSLPYLRKADVEQYLLEVLQDNAKAISVYTSIGFKVSRSFNYFVEPKENIRPKDRNVQRYRLGKINWADKKNMNTMRDFEPSWQNQFFCLERAPNDFVTIGAFDDNELIGYGIIETASGDMPQIAVKQTHRRQGVGTALLKELSGYNKAAVVRVINTDSDCVNINTFLEANGIMQKGSQYEMIYDI